MPGTQTVTLGTETGRGPNPEAFEVGVSELVAGALIYGPQWLYGKLKDYSDKMAEQKPAPARGGSRRRQGDYFFTDRPVGSGPRTRGRKQ